MVIIMIIINVLITIIVDGPRQKATTATLATQAGAGPAREPNSASRGINERSKGAHKKEGSKVMGAFGLGRRVGFSRLAEPDPSSTQARSRATGDSLAHADKATPLTHWSNL